MKYNTKLIAQIYKFVMEAYDASMSDMISTTKGRNKIFGAEVRSMFVYLCVKYAAPVIQIHDFYRHLGHIVNIDRTTVMACYKRIQNLIDTKDKTTLNVLEAFEHYLNPNHVKLNNIYWLKDVLKIRNNNRNYNDLVPTKEEFAELFDLYTVVDNERNIIYIAENIQDFGDINKILKIPAGYYLVKNNENMLEVEVYIVKNTKEIVLINNLINFPETINILIKKICETKMT